MKFLKYISIICSLFLSMICYGSENLEFITPLESEDECARLPQEKLSSSLDNLPLKSLAQIVGYLSDQVGTPRFKNECDLPFIIENVDNLASTNKYMQKAVYSNIVTQELLKSLSIRFKMPPIDIACKFKTKRMRALFEKHLEKSDDYQMFLVLQDIFKICEKIALQAKDYTVDMQYYKHQDDVEINKRHVFYCPISYTQKGFILDCGNQYREGESIRWGKLYTPWGKVSLFKKKSALSQRNSQFDFESIAIQQALFKEITALLDSIDLKYSSEKTSWYEVMRPIDFNEINLLNTLDLQGSCDPFMQISQDQTQDKSGQQILLTSSNAPILYKIHAVQDKHLPDPEMAHTREYRRYNERKALWEVMNNKFHKRVPEVLLKKTLRQDSFEILSREYPAPYEEHPSIVVTSIDDVAGKYAQLAARVIALPNYEHEDEDDDYACKILPCASHMDSSIVSDLTDEVNKSLLAEQRISFMSLGYDPDFSGHYCIAEQPVNNGIRLTVDCDCSEEEEIEVYTLWSLAFLENHYQSIINKFKNGWHQVNLIDNKNVYHYESEEAWVLFVQSELTSRNQGLISSLLWMFEFSSDEIYYTFIKSDASEQKDNRIFIWVKKDAMNEVKNRLGLNFSS